MSRRPAYLLVEDIRESIERIGRYVSGLDLQAFLEDEKTSDAVVRNLEIIGEVASRLPEAVRSRHPEIEWRGVVGLRNRIVHAYFGVDLEIVWQIVQTDLPLLGKAMTTEE